MSGQVAGVLRLVVLMLMLMLMLVSMLVLELMMVLARVLLRVLLRHVLAGEWQRPGRVVEEGELGAIGVAEVERAQRSVGREVERVHDC